MAWLNKQQSQVKWNSCNVSRSPIKKLFSHLWSCQRQRGWCHVRLWRDTRRPAAPTRGLWSCSSSIGGVRYEGHRRIKKTRSGLTHKCTHLGFLLLRLSVISFTQRGWVITRLNPDWRPERSTCIRRCRKSWFVLSQTIRNHFFKRQIYASVETLPGSSWWLAGT